MCGLLSGLNSVPLFCLTLVAMVGVMVFLAFYILTRALTTSEQISVALLGDSDKVATVV